MLKKVCFGVMFLFLVAISPAEMIYAKAENYKLSATKKTMEEGKSGTLWLKKAKNVHWKSNNKSVVRVKKKGSGKALLLAGKKGRATITATCRGKSYQCKVVVRTNDKNAGKDTEPERKTVNNSQVPLDVDAPKLNAETVSLYYRPSEYADILPVMESHKDSFCLKLSGTKKKVRKWEILGEESLFFTITDYGLVTLKHGTAYEDSYVEVKARITLTDGRTLTATIKGYNEMNFYLDSLFEKFSEENIRPDMTEKEKADRVAEYIGEISDYEFYNDNWEEIFLRGRGDCMASSYAMAVLCGYIGIKAQGCGSFDEHGKTVVKADGKYYIYTTGYNEPRPRGYMVSETSYEYLEKNAEKMGIWMGLFAGQE